MIDDFLKKNGLTLLPDNASREQGNLNTVYFVQAACGAKYVLRFQRDDNRADIQSYIDSQMKCLGAANLGARLCYRSMDEQVILMKRLSSKGIAVPAIRDHGPGWMLMIFVEGQSLKDTLPGLRGAEAADFIGRILRPFMAVHGKGECLWDRWGGNELMDSKGNVCFLDFDINIEWPETVPMRVRASFDLAFMLRGCIQFSADQDLAGRTVSGIMKNEAAFHETYDAVALRNFLDGQVKFYNAEYCQNPAAAPQDREKHLLINQAIKKVMGTIDEAPLTAPAAKRHPPSSGL